MPPANNLLETGGQPPLPDRLTTHGLRHTFASILIALGEDPVSVMVQLGHTDPGFSLRVYAHMMRRDADQRERLRDLTGRGRPGKGGRQERRPASNPFGRSVRRLRELMVSRTDHRE